MRFDRNLNTVWQSRTGNKNFWKCNGKFRSNWTGRSKRTRRRFRSVPFTRSVYFSTEIHDHFGIVESTLGPRSRSYNQWWPTTVTAKPKNSRQKQKHHGKTKNLPLQNGKSPGTRLLFQQAAQPYGGRYLLSIVEALFKLRRDW